MTEIKQEIKDTELYKCACHGREFRDGHNLRQHLNGKKVLGIPRKKNDKPKKEYKCNKCGKQFRDSWQLKRHHAVGRSCKIII